MAKAADRVTAPGVDIASDEPANADVAGLSYEQARDELISVVALLEGGQLGLEESMRLWQRGEALASHCSTWLDGAEAALNQDED
ncbi:exodeoxyribonuclease VII small subunit [Phycicoccus badiiscoriae]|uniref:Exodeoxyribonuclease VII small subunit n=1 Tax=Pedococcus badiiscoriae TaxID=642776 RepID=A0A852WBW3_9MICO|nr:exodeoxyribonuclease VII small subunit [Pedococcus badiiscoriae]NYG06289.1 exodeoxyribonuclease VII small subunit [Pedococcus badiiscoriae]